MKKPIPFGKYYLLEQVNVGGMAEVFKAKAYGVEGFERLIALKRILPNIAEDKEFIEMFIFEAKTAVQLNHANIAQIYELGKVEDAYFIALEYVHGRDLRGLFDRCRQKGESMPIAQACFVVMKICEGLDYAHNKRDGHGREMNLVHRDVSPQNVLISFEGEVKLIDFGIAKAANKASKTQAGILKGKFGYMSPEQVRGLPVDRRSDVFATGIVLYELLTGERLFVGESDFSTLEKVRNVEILPPSTYNRKIPDELERIVLKALAKDVEDRYQNAIDLHDDLQAFVYTAGEFYARKDLASWMKKGFAKEIEEEAAKLEQYRHIQLPEPGKHHTPAQPQRAATKKPTMSVPSIPPPPPSAAMRSSGRMAAVQPAGTPPPLMQGPRATMAMPAAVPPPTAQRGAQSLPPPPESSGDKLEWDDEELETQIYGSPEEEAAAKAAKNGDKADANNSNAPPHLNGNGQNGHHAHVAGSGQRQAVKEEDLPPPSVPNMVAHPMAKTMLPGPFEPSSLNKSGRMGSAAPMPKKPDSVPWAESGPHTKSGRTATAVAAPVGGKSKAPLIVIGAVLLAGAAAAAVFFLTRESGDDKKAAAANGESNGTGGGAEPPATPPTGAGGGAPAVAGAPASVNVITEPSIKLQAKLDGMPVGETPMNISQLAAGPHTIEILGNALWQARSEKFEVIAGETKEVRITLDPVAVKGAFATNPPGAKLFLEHDGARDVLGGSPQSGIALDPRKTYILVAEKEGFKPATQALEILGPDVSVTLELEKEGRSAPIASGGTRVKTGSGDKGSGDKGTGDKGSGDKGNVVATNGGGEPDKGTGDKGTGDKGTGDKGTGDKGTADKGGTGVLSINSKPWTTIFVDGREVGHTPKTDLELKSGSRKITLVNNELNIRVQFSVSIKAGETTKVFKDLREKTPEP